MHRISTKKRYLGFLGILALVAALAPRAASAEEENETARQRNPLADEPAVRARKLLVKNRLELTPMFEGSVNADFKHVFAFGVKVEYHLTDMLSIGGLGAFGVGIDTGLTGRITDTLPQSPTPGDPTPSRQQFEEHLNELTTRAAIYASVTPWYGKLAAFGKFDLNFDFYFQGGLALAVLSNSCCSFPTDSMPGGDPDRFIPGDDNPNNDPAINDGTKVGIYLGGGIHVFLSDFIALDLTVRDYLFSDNPSGLDFNADLAVKSDDNRFLNHLYMGIGASFFFPRQVKRTR